MFYQNEDRTYLCFRKKGLNVMKTPAWTRLDNASIIYPSCRTRKYATIFRMAVTLDEEVSQDLLGAALKNCMKELLI